VLVDPSGRRYGVTKVVKQAEPDYPMGKPGVILAEIVRGPRTGMICTGGEQRPAAPANLSGSPAPQQPMRLPSSVSLSIRPRL